MIPLSKGFYVGDALAYAGTCILTVLLGAIGQAWLLVPFIMFFGLHPLLNALQLRFNVNRWIACAVKALWFDFIKVENAALKGEFTKRPMSGLAGLAEKLEFELLEKGDTIEYILI